MEFIQLRSNLSLAYKHDLKKFIPTTELVFVCAVPNYVIEECAIKKDNDLKDIRFEIGSTGIDEMIELLNSIKKNMMALDNLSAELDQLIIVNVEKVDEKGEEGL